MHRLAAIALCLAAQAADAEPRRALGTVATADGATVALIDGWRQPDGARIAAVEITLAPGWHTYWRVPGESGIPPEFDWSGSKNLAAVAYEWPRPRVFDSPGGRSIGYSGTLVLPVVLTPVRADQPIDLALDLFFGVCAEICVPAAAHLSLRLDPVSGGRGGAIDAALADRPRTAREAGVTRVTCALAPGRRGYELTTTVTFDADPDPDQVAIIEPGDPGVWIGAPRSRSIGRDVVSRAALESTEAATGPVLDRAGLRLTLLDARRAVEIRGCDAPG